MPGPARATRRSGRVPRTVAGALVLAAAAGLVVGCSDEPEASPETFCGALRQVPSLASVFTGFADQDPGRLDRSLDDAEAAFGRLRETAPDDIRAAVDDHHDAVTSSLAVADYARSQCNVELNPTVPEDPTVTTTSEGGGSEGTTDDTTADGAPVGGL